jgi:phosphohistidine phosphatase
MELILWRHADAERGEDDLERRLTVKGKKQARRVAKWLSNRLPREIVVLASPARRAIQTAEALTDRFRIVPQLDGRASASEILTAAGWPDGEGTVIVVGHQPSLGRAAALCLTGREIAWSMKKGGIWWLEGGGDGEPRRAALRVVTSPDFL